MRTGRDQQKKRDTSGSTRPVIDYHPKARIHIVLMDGTLSSLAKGQETNIGLVYKMLAAQNKDQHQFNLHYQPGLQWTDWFRFHHILVGRGVDKIIRRAYGWLSSRYAPGDQIYLFGYSRGAFAVRSLCGLMARSGLLLPHESTERNIRRTYRHYRDGKKSGGLAQSFQKAPIEFVGVIDTVKAMGVRSVSLNNLIGLEHQFHNYDPVDIMQRGVHALAKDERRLAYRPLLWDSTKAKPNQILQMWFKGHHGDVGGQLGGVAAARPLSNVVLRWLLQEAEAAGLPLAPDWGDGLICDDQAPSTGQWHGFSKFFLKRKARDMGQDPSEHQFTGP